MTKTTFNELGLSEDTLAAITEKGFVHPTEVQEKAIPDVLNTDNDMLVLAQTGTGKTAAFGLPMMDTLEPFAGYPQALILTPTRELAIQVCKEINTFIPKKKFYAMPIYGGDSIVKQKQALKRGVDIVVGTPGRIYDHIRSKTLKLDRLKYFVIDEADELLDIGFKEELNNIYDATPEQKRVLFFSATMSKGVSSLTKKFLSDPIKISIKANTQQSLTEESYIDVSESSKVDVLWRVIQSTSDFYGMVFCRTKRIVDQTAKALLSKGLQAEALHGDLSQNQREQVLNKFRNRYCTVLVVTDVASRGIDVPDLTHVINFAVPQDAETYIHRIGRTGRAGKSGLAITFVASGEKFLFNRIQKANKSDIKAFPIQTVKNIMAKQNQNIQDKVFANLKRDEFKQFHLLAGKLLDNGTYSPEDIVSSLLQLAFADALDPEQYNAIKSPKGGDRGDRGPRSGRPNRFSRDRRGRSGRGGGGGGGHRGDRNNNRRSGRGGGSGGRSDRNR